MEHTPQFVAMDEGGFLYNWAVGASAKWGIALYGMSQDGQLWMALNLPTLDYHNNFWLFMFRSIFVHGHLFPTPPYIAVIPSDG